jgi:solute carrier family 25 carnitine/acylcarnitine transporter 20/29
VSIQFGALEYMKRIFTAQNLRANKGGQDGKTLAPIQLLIAGGSAGIANSIVSGPVEHIRIREYLRNDPF